MAGSRCWKLTLVSQATCQTYPVPESRRVMRVGSDVNHEELHYWTPSDLALALERRDLSPVEVTQAQLERIEALDDQLHAYVTVTAERALERAKEAELEIGRNGTRWPLHGVPIALKDLYATRGVRTTAGTRILRDWISLPFDVSGSPTLTLPCGYRDGRTPIGLQLVARHLEEGLLVRAGDAFQRATERHHRNPPL